MTIQDVKDYLTDNPQYYSNKNDTKIQNIKTNQRYYFTSDCGHEFMAYPKNVIRDWELKCPVCSGKIVAKGINDFNTIHPELSKYLYDINDGYNYTAQSNHVVKWRCPYCGYQWSQTFNKVVSKLNKCRNCGDNRSYSERIMSCVLDELLVLYETEVQFDWSDNKRYDFYLPEYNAIIEMHGKQHYTESFTHDKSRNLYEEKTNDEYKQYLASKNSIANYIIIDASRTDFNWIKSKICESILPTLLCFSPKDINWQECDKNSMANLIYLVCKDYDDGVSQKELIIRYGKSRNTIRYYLQKGAKFGWCNYNAPESIRRNAKERGEWVLKTMCKPVNQIDPSTNNIICVFPSLQEAQRQLGISHIWDCIHGKRNVAGGYKWEYVETS